MQKVKLYNPLNIINQLIDDDSIFKAVTLVLSLVVLSIVTLISVVTLFGTIGFLVIFCSTAFARVLYAILKGK
jgi:hypothetical protein